jgi:hypothetical protein
MRVEKDVRVVTGSPEEIRKKLKKLDEERKAALKPKK